MKPSQVLVPRALFSCSLGSNTEMNRAKPPTGTVKAVGRCSAFLRPLLRSYLHNFTLNIAA